MKNLSILDITKPVENFEEENFMIQFEKINGKLVRKVDRKKQLSREDKAKEEIMTKVDTLTTEQREAFDMMTDEIHKSIFLTGAAGSGKSYVLKLAVDYLRRVKGSWVAVTSSTASSAKLIKAVTVHSYFHFKPEILLQSDGKPLAHAPSTVCKADIIIIDEISMIRFDCFMSVCASIKKADAKRALAGLPPIKLIVVGDFCQIPPVLTEKDQEELNRRLGYEVREGFAFQTKEWEDRHFETIKLKQIIRQKGEDEFIYMLNKIREGDKSYFHWFNQNCSIGYDPMATAIFPYNRQVKAFNLKKLAELHGEEYHFKADYNGDATEKDAADMGIESELVLKAGCRVMIRSNGYASADWVEVAGYRDEDKSKAFCNGSTGIFRGTLERNGRECLAIDLDGTDDTLFLYKKTYDIYEYIELGGELKKVKTGSSIEMYPLTLAYAISLHKSQGCSIDKIYLQPHGCFASGMLYVGLSRVKGSAKNIFLADFVRPDDIILSETVKDFYRENGN